MNMLDMSRYVVAVQELLSTKTALKNRKCYMIDISKDYALTS